MTNILMANNESQKRQLRAQISRLDAIIEGLEEKISENPKDRSATEELRRKKQERQGLVDELNNTE